MAIRRLSKAERRRQALRMLTELACTILWLALFGAIVVGLLALLTSVADASTPRARVAVLHCYLQAIAGPALPDSLINRPRKDLPDSSGDAAPGDRGDMVEPRVPDLFAPYEDDEDWGDDLSDEELEQRLAECVEVEAMQWMLQHAFSEWMVVYATSPNCLHCKKFEKGGWSELAENSWFLFKFDVKERPFLAEWFDVTVTPTVILLHNGEEVGRLSGGGVSAQDVKDLAKPPPPQRQAPSRSKATPRRTVGPSTSCVALRGRWTWPGGTISALRRHLCSPPHSFSREAVASMSPGQLISAHDQWHNSHGGGGGGGRGRRMRRVDFESEAGISPAA